MKMPKKCQKCSEWNDLSPRRWQNVLNQVRNGQMSQSAAARLLGVGQATISRKLRDQNLNPIGRPRKGVVLMTRGNSQPLQSSQNTLLSWLTHPLAPDKTGQPSTEVPMVGVRKPNTNGTEDEAKGEKAVCPLCGQVRVSTLNNQFIEKCQGNVWRDVKKTATGEFLSARLTETASRSGHYRNENEESSMCWAGKETKGEERITKEEVHWEQGSWESK